MTDQNTTLAAEITQWLRDVLEEHPSSPKSTFVYSIHQSACIRACLTVGNEIALPRVPVDYPLGDSLVEVADQVREVTGRAVQVSYYDLRQGPDPAEARECVADILGILGGVVNQLEVQYASSV